MKVLGVISLVLTCVAARGSGPYLPSGWKPDGPAFYLPSEVSKPLNEPLKDLIFSESEASGSDFLREYGPPKDQEESQYISQQGLPDVGNEQLFIDTVVAKEDSNVVTEVIDQKLEVNEKDKAVEEALPITESQSVTATESITNVEEETVQLKDEITTLANAVESVAAVDELGYITEPTVAVVLPTEKVTIEVNIQSENQTLEDGVEAQQEVSDQSARLDEESALIENIQVSNGAEQSSSDVSEQSVRQVESTVLDTTQVTSGTVQSNSDVSELVHQIEESAPVDTIQVTSETEQLSTDVSEQTEPSVVESFGTSVTPQAAVNFDVTSPVEEIVKRVEEVKEVEKNVQNIPELIIRLENDAKSQKIETIQEVPAIVQEVFGSLEQAPEGFLEYGPPGFREYGPPKEELRDNTIEEIPETQSIENSQIRRRRFSPKLRSLKSH